MAVAAGDHPRGTWHGTVGRPAGRRGAPGTRRTRRTQRRDDRDIRLAYRSRLGRVTRALSLWPAMVVFAALVVASPVVAPLVVAERGVTWVDDRYFTFAPLPDDLGRPDVRSFVRASDGTLLATLHAEQNREPVPLERIPLVLQRAVLATEDRDFFRHDGVDERAILRALAANVRARSIEQGASTITQQLVRNTLLTPDVTLERKVQEAAYAIELEGRISKEEILEGYLNTVYFGNGAYGVAAAAEFYFDHRVEDTTLDEAALLAGLIRSPAYNDPLRHPDAARERRDIVLAQMRDAGWLDAEDAEAAVARPVQLDVHRVGDDVPFPFVVEHVKQVLLVDERLGATAQERVDAVFRGGLTIETTLDVAAQEHAEAALAAFLTDPVADPLGAVVSLEPDSGAIRALAVGPKSFGTCPDESLPCARTKVNPVVPSAGGSGRQPGSSFKPFVLAAALDAGLPPTWRTDTRSGQPIPGCFTIDEELWRPRNYDEKSAGTIGMYEAIRRSNNVFHAKLGREVGPGRVASMAQRLGITTEVPPVCAVALGAASVFPLDMAVAYATLASGGTRCAPHIVTRVTDRQGRVLVDDRTPRCVRVLDEAVAARVTDMLTGVVQAGTGRAAAVDGHVVAGKTGTTNDFRDAWFLGYTPDLVAAVWVGFEQPAPMLGILDHARITGGTIPARIWHAYASEVLADVAPRDFPDPDELDRAAEERRG